MTNKNSQWRILYSQNKNLRNSQVWKIYLRLRRDKKKVFLLKITLIWGDFFYFMHETYNRQNYIQANTRFSSSFHASFVLENNDWDVLM